MADVDAEPPAEPADGEAPPEAPADGEAPPADPTSISADDGAVPFVPPAAAKRAARRLRAALHSKDDGDLVEKLKTIVMADLSSGIIDNNSGAAFIAALKAGGGEAPLLEKLYMQCNSLLGPPFMTALATIQLPLLKKLNMGGTNLRDDGTVTIATVLKDQVWPCLEEINLSSCTVGDEGACALAISLKRCAPCTCRRHARLCLRASVARPSSASLATS